MRWWLYIIIVMSWSMQFWAYFVDFSRKRPPLVSDHFLVHQGWSLTRELTVVGKGAKNSVTARRTGSKKDAGKVDGAFPQYLNAWDRRYVFVLVLFVCFLPLPLVYNSLSIWPVKHFSKVFFLAIVVSCERRRISRCRFSPFKVLLPNKFIFSFVTENVVLQRMQRSPP